MMYRLIWHMAYVSCTYTYNVYIWAAVVLKQSLKCVFKRCVYIFVFKRFLDADQPTSDDIELRIAEIKLTDKSRLSVKQYCIF